MIKVLIVDDEVLMRVTLRSIIEWEKYGFEIVADCNSGYQALEYMENHAVDLLITDVKMPGISGLELLKRLVEENRAPVTIILSGYNEFDLVREAFRLGAVDYLIKGEMNEKSLLQILGGIRQKYFPGREETVVADDVPEKKTDDYPETGMYGVGILEIDDFQRQTRRFQDDLEQSLEEPMWELVMQIPRVKKYGKRIRRCAGHYIFLYQVTRPEYYREDIIALLKQMQSVWKNYMNLTVSVSICDVVDAGDIKKAIEQAEELMLLSPLTGRMALVNEWEKKNIAEHIKKEKVKYERFVSFLYDINESACEQGKNRFFQEINEMELEDAKEECLSLIALIALKFREYDGDFYQIFPEEINYYEKLDRLETKIELERWFHNYFTWILEYLKQQVSGSQTDLILRAKRFMTDNFSNPELSLKSVADYVGLNEKYFSTVFTQKTGSTFRDYLTEIRMEKAKQLLKTTDMKVYEICDCIGYNNVEHFNRMFKKMTDVSPGTYRKENMTI